MHSTLERQKKKFRKFRVCEQSGGMLWYQNVRWLLHWNLLIKNDKYIEQVIKNSPKVVAIHSEDENMLVDRMNFIKKGDVCSHYEWRNIDCALNSSKN